MNTLFNADQFMAANKANVETLFGLTAKAFEGVEKLVELNLQVAKASLTEAAETSTAALSIKDAQELMALQAGLLQPAAEKAAAAWRPGVAWRARRARSQRSAHSSRRLGASRA